MTEQSKTLEYMIPSNVLGYLHGNSLMKLLNKKQFGILHTGILGDIVVGTYSSEDFHRKWNLLDGSKSSIKVQLLIKKDIKFDYQNEEIFKFYNSGLNGVRAFEEILHEEMEQYSPFLDIDFLDYVVKLPLVFRRHHKLYFEWVNKYYSEAAKYKWTGDGSNINTVRVNILGRRIPVDQLIKRVINKVKHKMGYSTESKKDMNPFELYSSIPYVMEFIHTYNTYNPLMISLFDQSSVHSFKTYDLFNLYTLNALITQFEAINAED